MKSYQEWQQQDSSGNLEQTDISPFLRLIKQISGQDLNDPNLIAALKQLSRKAPQETATLLQGIVGMNPGQLKRMQTGLNRMTAPQNNQ